MVYNPAYNKILQTKETLPHGMCYSHFGNGVRNGAISITQFGFINDRYKVNPVGQWGKILVMAMGFVDHLGPLWVHCFRLYMNKSWNLHGCKYFSFCIHRRFFSTLHSSAICTVHKYIRNSKSWINEFGQACDTMQWHTFCMQIALANPRQSYLLRRSFTL